MTLVLRIPKGDKLTKAEMDNNLTYLEGLSQSKLGTGSFTAFTSSYTTGSFTGSFKGDGSGLTGIPSGTSISTGSFATTGSNVFIGGQIITGSFTARSGSGFLTSSVKFIHNTISPSQGSSTFEVRHINSEYSENFAVKLFADDFIAKMQYEKDGSTFDMLRTNLAGDLHLTQNTRLFGTDLRIDGTLKLTGSLSSAASANFLGNVTASVFTGSFVGDGSGLTGISGVTPIATGSFATTGSNSFVGTETITGALRITGSLNLRSPSYPTSGSLVRIDDTRTHIFVRPSGSSTSGNIQLYDSGDSRSILIINASQTSIGSEATSNAYGNNSAQNFIRGNTQFFQNITSSANIQAVSFIGDGSGLTGIPVIGTGSFATTGSNTFKGNQIISSSLLVTDKIESTGSLILKPDVNSPRYLEVYNTAPSDTHITASGGQIFIGDDTTYVKVDNYSNFNRIDIVANSGVYVSGLTEVTGSLLVTGSANINGFITYPQVSASLNFANDTAASGGGVPLGGLYHTSGALKIRLV
jgi:fibronectin-binding autotransporter adhesin